MARCKYGKVQGHHCWWLTINGKSVANFDNEFDVDGIIATEVELNQSRASITQVSEFVSQIPLHTENEHVLHYVEMINVWLNKA
ncbi:hypothetical protein [Pseudoalteromonas galatheae]|uniref:hypothetical protein n=1 Tax=Pseudoalteromonas galatheae TaxID=579562 RepID=UPI0030CAEDF6